jgi:DNA-binding response OmpR family regulator
MLPEVSGIRLVKTLRAAEVGTPAIILTVRDQGGELTAENEDGGGARFTLVLPPGP